MDTFYLIENTLLFYYKGSTSSRSENKSLLYMLRMPRNKQMWIKCRFSEYQSRWT